MGLIDLAYEFGPSIGIILFFLGRDAAREERMEKRIDQLNEFIQTKLLEVIEDATNKEPRCPKDDKGCPISTED